MTDSRWTRRGSRHAYNTTQHKYRGVRTPGGKLVRQRVTKKTKGPRCGDTGVALPGIQHLPSASIRRTKKRERTVSRVYGGCLSHAAVKERIIRAILLDEQKAVKMLLAADRK